MFESRSPYDRLEARPHDGLKRGNGPRKHGSNHDPLPPPPPHRPTPRPLPSDPPILMAGVRRRSAVGSRRVLWALLAGGVLAAAGIALLLGSDRPDDPYRATLPAPPTTPDPAAPAEERATEATQPEPAPPPEPVTAPPPGETSPPPEASSESESAADERPIPPQADQAAEAARGFLFINSRPWGRVLVDGRSIGNTPVVRVPIAPGTHELRVERDGFYPFETIITVEPGAAIRVTEIVLRSVIS